MSEFFPSSPLTSGLTKRQASVATWTVFFAVLSMGLGQTVVFAILPSLARDLGMMEIEVGLIITASSVVFFLFTPLWGRLSDRWDRKSIIMIGLVGYSGGTLVFATVFLAGYKELLSGVYLLISLVLARMCQSVVMSATPPAAAAYIADITTADKRTVGMGRIGAASNLGAILGPAVAGGLVFLSLLAPLYAAASLTLFCSVLVWVLLPKVASFRAIDTPTPRSLRYMDPRYRNFILIAVPVFTAFSILQQTLGFYFQDEFAMNPVEAASRVGLTMMIMGLASLFAQGFLVQLLGWQPIILIKVGVPFAAIGFAQLAIGDALQWVLIGSVFIGFGVGLVVPGFTAAASLTVSADEQGSLAGLISACPAFGFIIGPVLGTGIYQLDHRLPYFLALGIMIVLSGFVFTLSSKAFKSVRIISSSGSTSE